MNYYKLTVSYDGSGFHGWQKQHNTKQTIQEYLEQALRELLSDSCIQIHGSGRTDAGVHAAGQTAHFKTAAVISDMALFVREANKRLPSGICLLQVEKTDASFHARFCALSKEYRYFVECGERVSVFKRKYRMSCQEALSLESMLEAARYLEGTHDFRGFSSEKNPEKKTERTIYKIEIKREDNTLLFIYRGDGFLYNMVRILTGTLLEIGAGQRDIQSILQNFQRPDRRLAGFTAPPEGLFLWEVQYEKTTDR